MKYTALLVAAALLWFSHVSAFGQISNITPSRQGIAYAASAKTVTTTYTATAADHTSLANAASAAFTDSCCAAPTAQPSQLRKVRCAAWSTASDQPREGCWATNSASRRVTGGAWWSALTWVLRAMKKSLSAGNARVTKKRIKTGVSAMRSKLRLAAWRALRRKPGARISCRVECPGPGLASSSV